jgi:hypothetical protein
VGDNMNTMKKNTEDLIDGSKDVVLERNIEKTKYIFMSCYQNAGQNCNFKTFSRSFETVAKFRHLG